MIEINKLASRKNQNKLIIGLTGRGRSGKNTVSELIEKAQQGVGPRFVHEIAFAKPMKKCAEMLHPEWDLFNPEFDKESVDPKYGYSPREFLQDFGTEYMREQWSKDIWVNIGEDELLGSEFNTIVFTDCRFDNEAEMIKRNGGVIWEVIRNEGEQVRPHESEMGISQMYVDIKIFNNDQTENWRTRLSQSVGEALEASLEIDNDRNKTNESAE